MLRRVGVGEHGVGTITQEFAGIVCQCQIGTVVAGVINSDTQSLCIVGPEIVDITFLIRDGRRFDPSVVQRPDKRADAICSLFEIFVGGRKLVAVYCEGKPIADFFVV